jgi:hypothetical protein
VDDLISPPLTVVTEAEMIFASASTRRALTVFRR